MSLVGRRIKKWSGGEATVREVTLVTVPDRWVALVRRDDGALETWDLSYCSEVESEPVQMPIPGPP